MRGNIDLCPAVMLVLLRECRGFSVELAAFFENFPFYHFPTDKASVVDNGRTRRKSKMFSLLWLGDSEVSLLRFFLKEATFESRKYGRFRNKRLHSLLPH